MNDYSISLLFAQLGRLFSEILAGFLCYLAYKLYHLGVFEKAEEVKLSLGQAHIGLKRVAPGVVFAVLGTVIAFWAIFKPISAETANESISNRIANSRQNLPASAAKPCNDEADSQAHVSGKTKPKGQTQPTGSDDTEASGNSANSARATQPQTTQRTITKTHQLPPEYVGRQGKSTSSHSPVVAPNPAANAPPPK